jgi:D-alanine-D-alanine ligase
MVKDFSMKIGITFNLKGEIGGASAAVDGDEEFDSPETIAAISSVLRGGGHTVRQLGFGRSFMEKLLADPPDFVFNIAEGLEGRNRESQVPAILEMLSIPYTGSDPLTLGLTLDKELAKGVVTARGLAAPRHIIIRNHRRGELPDLCGLEYPLIVKPSVEGSSKGIRLASRVCDDESLRRQVRWLGDEYGCPVMVEEFCDGEEFTVGIIGNDRPAVVGVMMIRHRTLPKEEFLYSLEVKRDWKNQVEYLVPPPVDDSTRAAVEQLALGAYDALGCRDVSRVDIRMRDGIPHFLEVNPLPGLSPEYGDLVIMARRRGWSYEQLILTILDNAVSRTGAGGAGTDA